MIADGRLPHGWTDQYAIKDVQRDVCAISTRLDDPKKPVRGKRNESTNYVSTSAASAAEAKPHYEYVRAEYNKEADGVPCKDWNNGLDCGYLTPHGLLPDHNCHLCAWCATKNKRANAAKRNTEE